MNHPDRTQPPQVTSDSEPDADPEVHKADTQATPHHHRDEIRDRGALDALGRAITAPVMDSARGEDPFLPAPGADDLPPPRAKG